MPGQHAFGRAAGTHVQVDARARHGRGDGAEHVAVVDQADARAGLAHGGYEVLMAPAIEDAHVHVLHRLAQRLGHGGDVLGRGLVDAHLAGARGAGGDLLHVGVGANSSAPRGAMAMVVSALGLLAAHRFVPSSGSTGDVDLFPATAQLLADVQHGGLVALALADDDAAREVDLVERLAHGGRGRLVGRHLVALAVPGSAGDGRLLGDGEDFHDSCGMHVRSFHDGYVLVVEARRAALGSPAGGFASFGEVAVRGLLS